METKTEQPFTEWLTGQTARQDATGKIARATVSQRIPDFTDRMNLVVFAMGVGVTATEARATWREWLESQRGVDMGRKSSGLLA